MDEHRDMPFGKHKGEPIEDVPTAYLWWVIEESNAVDRHSGLAEAIEDELEERED